MATGNGVWEPGKITLTAFNTGVVRAAALASVSHAAEELIGYIHEELDASGRVDTGALRDSYVYESRLTALGAEAEVYSTLPPLPSGREIADVVNRGSGIYGPYGQPIVSPNGGVLLFNPGRRASGSAVAGVGRRRTTTSYGRAGQFTGSTYAMSVTGQRPTFFLDRAMARLSLTDFVL